MNERIESRLGQLTTTPRRRFLSRSTAAVLSAAAVALRAGRPRLARGAESGPRDARILSTALAAEHGAVAAYQLGAVSAYAGAIPLFEGRALSQAAASILADEAMHWAVLRHALGLDPVPGAFFS